MSTFGFEVTPQTSSLLKNVSPTEAFGTAAIWSSALDSELVMTDQRVGCAGSFVAGCASQSAADALSRLQFMLPERSTRNRMFAGKSVLL